MRFLVVHIISFAFIVLLVNWFSTICFAESLWKQDPGVISEFCARQGLMYGPAPGYIVTCVPPDKLDQIRKNGLCPSKLFSSGTGINGEFVWLSNEPFYHSQNGNVVLVPIEAAQRHGAYPTVGLAGQPGVWRCPNHIPPEELIFGGSSLRGAGPPGQRKQMIWEPPPAASSPTRQILNPLADPPGTRIGEGERIATTVSTPPRPANCINGPSLSGPTKFKKILRNGVNLGRQNLNKVLLSTCLDPIGLVKEACKSGLKGAVKSGPFVVCEIAVQAGTGYAVRSAGGNENQEEGACALASIGTGAALGGCVGRPPGAAVGAGLAGGVEAGIGVCKIGYYTTSSFYNYGVCESVGSWLEEGYNPIDYWCGY